MVIKVEEPPSGNIIMEKKKRKSVGGDGGEMMNKVKAGKVIKMKQGTLPVKKVNSVTSPSSGSSLVEGMSTAEITMIRRLAGNDPNIRKKTMRKLRKWLSTLVLRFPDDFDSKSEVEPNIIRVWKALFYCMWMADKPLPQEQLAEQISNLVPIVGIKPNILIIFVEWFFRTMAREWNWIDRFRLDKFMMLFRRFLRKTLQTMASRKWSVDLVNGFLRIVRVYVFNHHPEIKFKKGEPASEPIAQCPMGLQLHFIDIFLEELAKAGAEGLKPSKVIKFLSPFIEEMASNSDNRVLDVLTERIFNHLMKQSDVGIDYQEGLLGIDEDDSEEDFDEEEDAGEDDDEEENDDDAEDGDDAMGEDEVFSADPGPMDPRAGAVDVILPQLQLDYSILAEKLTEAGGSKTVKKRNRAKLYSLASNFKDLVQGNYPLALPEEGSRWKPAIPKQELERATQRLLELEVSESADAKIRKTKKQRRRDARKLAQNEQLDDTAGSEDNSSYLNDSNFVDRVDDNYSSYVDEQMDKSPGDQSSLDAVDSGGPSPNKKKKRKKGDRSQVNDGNGDGDGSYLEQNDSDDETVMPKLKKKKKYKTVVEVEADELNGFGDELDEHEELSVSVDQSPPKSKKHRLTPSPNKEDQSQDTVVNIQLPKKKRKSLTLGSGKVLTSIGGGQDLMQLQSNLVAKRKYKSLSPSNTSLSRALDGKANLLHEDLCPPFLTPMKHSELLRKKLKLGGARASEGNSRRINFVLTKNLEHEATDYMPSISKSPAIPFDASKTPTSGILKSKLKDGLTPVGRKSVGGIKISPRKKALEFF